MNAGPGWRRTFPFKVCASFARTPGAVQQVVDAARCGTLSQAGAATVLSDEQTRYACFRGAPVSNSG
jgi:hypothetical protein